MWDINSVVRRRADAITFMGVRSIWHRVRVDDYMRTTRFILTTPKHIFIPHIIIMLKMNIRWFESRIGGRIKHIEQPCVVCVFALSALKTECFYHTTSINIQNTHNGLTFPYLLSLKHSVPSHAFLNKILKYV